MRYLLDTCVLYWYVADASVKLPNKVSQVINNTDNEIFVSVATIWELAIKSSLGRIELPLGLNEAFENELVRNGFELIDISYKHASRVRDLPFVHRDPFDRLLISQCRRENFIAITNDKIWSDRKYDIKTLWD